MTPVKTHDYHGRILLAQIKFYPNMDEESNAQHNVGWNYELLPKL